MNMRFWIPSILLLLCTIHLSACQQTRPDAKPTQSQLIDGHLPISQAIAPVHYKLDIQIDPVGGVNRGSMTLVIDVKKGTNEVVLHAQDLNIEHVSTTPFDKMLSSAHQAGEVHVEKNGAVKLKFKQALTTGAHSIHLSWTGKITTAPTGLYRINDQGSWYAFTQFEPLEARRAFPCMDEPRFKATFDVSLSVPKGNLALANTPETWRGVRPQTGTMETYRFERSKPMPTYLVAFAVGPFDVVEQAAKEKDLPPIRVITPKGKAKLAKYALETTPAILRDLQTYFDHPYPYKKLDVVAVPNFAAGAMENIGLVTFREQLLLLNEAQASPAQKYRMRSIMAHELAHMWFGNFVTPAWWNDLWLNESFATWMASEVMVRTAPEFDPSLRQVRGISGLFARDSMPKTRAIRQPIKHGGDIYNAFDGMTYAKGAALLRMVEFWIGAEVFKKSIRRYLKSRAHGVAVSGDLMAAFKKESGKDVQAMLSRFLDQPGVPALAMKMTCENSIQKVSLSQSRYVPKGSTLSTSKPWTVPVCFAMLKNGKRTTHCELVTPETKEITLPGQTCYDLVYPNADAKGYYLWQLDSATAWAPYAKNTQGLTIRERLALFEQLNALSQSDSSLLPVSYALSMQWIAESDMRLFDRAAGKVSGMRDTAQRKGLMSSYVAMINALYQGPFDKLGLEPGKDESMSQGRARRNVIGALGGVNDAYILSNAQTVLVQFLKNPESVPAHRTSWALPFVVRAGDATLWNALLNVVKTTKNPRVRGQAISALGGFRDEALLKKSWNLLLDGTLRSSEMWSVLGPSFGHKPSYQLMWTWLGSSYDILTQKLGPLAGRSMPWLASGFCSKADQQKVTAFFKPRLKTSKGMARNLTNVQSRIDRCITRRAQTDPIIVEILKKYTPAPKAPVTIPEDEATKSSTNP